VKKHTSFFPIIQDPWNWQLFSENIRRNFVQLQPKKYCACKDIQHWSFGQCQYGKIPYRYKQLKTARNVTMEGFLFSWVDVNAGIFGFLPSCSKGSYDIYLESANLDKLLEGTRGFVSGFHQTTSSGLSRHAAKESGWRFVELFVILWIIDEVQGCF
jgi:hypothetical protein